MTSPHLVEDAQINYWRLLPGLLLTLVVSLSIHVAMIQILHVPFPEYADAPAWATLLNSALSLLAVLYLVDWAGPQLTRFSKLSQSLIVFCLYAGLREELRGIVMNGVVTTGWLFDIMAGLPGLIYSLVLSCFAVLLSPFLRRPITKVILATGIAFVMLFMVRPGLKVAFAPALSAVARFDHDEIYKMPYGWHVLVPAYVTYLEPALSCLVIAALTWQNLPPTLARRLITFALMILLMRSMLLPTLVYSFYSKAPLIQAILSQSQFLLETLALAVLTGLVWHYAGNGTIGAAPRNDALLESAKRQA